MKILPKALDMIKAGGGKYVAGGYNKTKSIIGTPPPNRYVLIRYDGGAEAFDKVWNGGLKEWVEKEGSMYAGRGDRPKPPTPLVTCCATQSYRTSNPRVSHLPFCVCAKLKTAPVRALREGAAPR